MENFRISSGDWKDLKKKKRKMLNAILIQKASSDPPRADSFSRGDKKGRWDKALPDPTTISLESPPGHPTSSTILSFLIAVFHPTPVPCGLLTQQWAFSYHEEWGITETEVDQGKGRFGEQGLLLVSGTVVPETARLTSSILTSLHPFFLSAPTGGAAAMRAQSREVGSCPFWPNLTLPGLTTSPLNPEKQQMPVSLYR